MGEVKIFNFKGLNLVNYYIIIGVSLLITFAFTFLFFSIFTVSNKKNSIIIGILILSFLLFNLLKKKAITPFVILFNKEELVINDKTIIKIKDIKKIKVKMKWTSYGEISISLNNGNVIKIRSFDKYGEFDELVNRLKLIQL
ncbi:hypothetical protein [uncultured Psychroserpens sp.]|uniref:hypothetical protein n=1 Tax=uncultured Psychroserpens sp. TaxID=255436 RepID=UPI00263127EB|nr:hypothetical protein [uncultured Psychroserpens sp.]